MFVIALLPALIGGCKVVSIEEDHARRAQRSEGVDPARFADAGWDSRVVPAIRKRAMPLADLNIAVAAGLDAAGAAHGRQAGEGSPWTFAVSGIGTVTAIDRASPRGTVSLSIVGSSGSIAAQMQIGPFVSGTSIRDALDFMPFNDFRDQLAYADVGNALTTRALKDAGPVFASVKLGDTIEFLATTNLRAASDPVVLTPVWVQRKP